MVVKKFLNSMYGTRLIGSWKIRKLWLENQMVLAIQFGGPQKTVWAVIWGDAILYMF